MAGIPPLGGFFAKYFVLLHAFEKGLFVEVIVGLATSLISTYYYLRIIKIVKFEQPDGAMPASPCLTSRRQGQLFIAEALL
jgi:NADH-quinone oxidoreductase subunit N